MTNMTIVNQWNDTAQKEMATVACSVRSQKKKLLANGADAKDEEIDACS